TPNQSIEKIKPYIGVFVLAASIYFAINRSNDAYTIQGGLLLCGIAFGVIIQRTRFCFVKCFRDPFMTGEGEASKAMAVSLIISMLGFAALKWNGFRAEDIYIVKAFWVGGLGGGIIFGIGMLLSGGCGSGSVWRAGEGQIKLIVAVFCFALSTSLFKKLMRSSEELTDVMGEGVFVVDYLGYAGGLFAFILLMFIYFLAAEWNDRTGKLMVDM
ncbi:MAG: YeeE/YedE family protein, partial [Proteobacteria bacterium]|nr:YeeE/YedE family protein [Pseudomonadota bacterium]